ncbi:MAG: 2-hydroxyacyl-CoA dehydratase [Dehalococcoidia bacterium]|nr:2-hydroxyacyl-CoA dehydratase [Dehalococcoidia bacterium]
MSETATPAKTEKKRAINRLKSMYPLRNLVQQDYVDTLQASNEGKPTVWSMLNYWEGDLPLKAMGLNIVYPENYATLLAASGAAEPFLDASDSDGFPNHMCGYGRATIGYSYRMMKENGGKIPPDAPLGGMAKPALLLGSGIICDARFKWFQALARYFDAPEWCLEMPMMATFEGTEPDLEEYQVKFLTREIRDFIEFLEKLLKKKMDWARLEELIVLATQIHETNYQINEARKAIPGPMHSTDFWSSMPPSLFFAGDMKVSLKLYQDMLAEVQERVKNKESGINYPERYRIIFAELPPWHSLKFFDQLAEKGWNFVFESFGYHNTRPIDLSKVSDPCEKLARFARNFWFNIFPEAKKDGISNPVVETYLKIGRGFKADGFFMHPLISCRAASCSLRTVQHFEQEKLDIPSLWVEGDIIDKRVFNPQEVLAKAEAFEQTMDHYRKVRKSKGLDW